MSTAKRQLLLSIGAVHVDDTATPAEALVPGASNPVRWTRSIGGVSANALRAIRRESSSLAIDFIAAVGDDELASVLTDALQQQAITTRFVTLKDTVTGRYSVVLDHDGELFIGLADVGNAESLTQDHFIEIAGSLTPDAVMLDTNLHQDTITAVTQQVGNHWQCPLIGLAVSPVKVRKLLPIRHQLSLLICNRREAIALLRQTENTTTISDSASTETLAVELASLGFSTFVLSDGADPVFIYESKRLRCINVPPLDIESTVNGAGDALSGAVVALWLSGSTLDNAVKNGGLPAASRILRGDVLPHRL